MKLKRPTRWPCSADSSRNAGYCGSVPRSFRNAETGVSRSSMNVWRSGTRLCSRASARTSSSDGSTLSAASSTAAAIEHLLGVRQRAAAAAQQHGEVVEDVRRLLVQALVGLLASGAGDLLGLLFDLLAYQPRIVEQLDGVGARGPLARAIRERALERGKRLVRRAGLELALVEAGAFAGVAGRAGRLDEREERVAVAVEPQRANTLDVPRGRALVPVLLPRAAPKVQLAALARAPHGLGVRVGQGQDLPGSPVLDDDRDEPTLVICDLHCPRDSA